MIVPVAAEKWAVLAGAAFLLVVVFAWFGERVRLGWPHLLALALVGWATLSLSWSPDWLQGLHQAQLAFLMLVAFLAAPYMARLIPWLALATLIFAGFVGVALDVFGNENFAAEYLLVALPLALRAGYWSLLAVPFAWLVVFSGTKTLFFPIIAAICGWMIWAIVRRKPWMLVGIVAVAVLVFVKGSLNGLAVAIPFESLRASVFYRLEGFTNTAAMWLDRPLFGHGFGSFNHEYPRFAESHLDWVPDWPYGSVLLHPTDHIGAAHNEFLQLGAELGLVGFLLGMAFLVLLLRRWRGHPNAALAVWLLLGACLIGFPLQNPHTAVMAALAFGLLAGKGSWEFPAKWWIRGGTVFPAMLVAWGAWTMAGADADFRAAQWLLKEDRPAAALVRNTMAVDRYPLDWTYRAQLPLTFRALLHSGRPVDVSVSAADRIYGIGASASPYSPALLAARFEFLTGIDCRSSEVSSLVERLHAIRATKVIDWQEVDRVCFHT